MEQLRRIEDRDWGDDIPFSSTLKPSPCSSSRAREVLQLAAKHKVATPAQWKQGEDVIIAGSVSDDDARKMYPHGWKAPKRYIRIVPQPQ